MNNDCAASVCTLDSFVRHPRVKRLRHHRLYDDVFNRYARRCGLRPTRMGEQATHAMHMSDGSIERADRDVRRGPWLMLVPNPTVDPRPTSTGEKQ
jgi:hypothetical protein